MLKWIYILLLAPATIGLECELFDQKCQTRGAIVPANSSCYTSQRCIHFPGLKPACYAMFSQGQRGLGPSVVMKGCTHKSSDGCARSVCRAHAQERNSARQRDKQYYCCCTGDKCNRHVVVFVEEEKEESGIEESIRQLTLLIWIQFVAAVIFSSLIAIAYMVCKLIISIRRRRAMSRVVCNKGAHRVPNMFRWTRNDFQLITCLVRSKFGEVWQARPHGSNQIVRIRLTAGSDEVYIYDRHFMVKDKSVHSTSAL